MQNRRMLFDSFNARYLTLAQVRETFIPNNSYKKLWSNSHALLMGPRGSGKTTLLKMLSPMALLNTKTFKSIPFWAIYIPTDENWKKPIDESADKKDWFRNYSEIISKGIVTTSVLISFCMGIREILEANFDRRAQMAIEFELCSSLMLKWNLDDLKSPSIDFLISYLRRRFSKINYHLNQAKYTVGSEENIDYSSILFIFEDYFSLILEGIFEFERIVSPKIPLADRKSRWALCFDELEIAPKWLQVDLLRKLRSSDQKIILKLTTSPIVSLYDKGLRTIHQVDAQEANDYEVIRIWPTDHSQEDWEKFSEKLVASHISRSFRGVGKFSPNELFGSSNFDRAITKELAISGKVDESVSDFSVGAPSYELFKEFAKQDTSFRQFLSLKGINPLNPVAVKSASLDTVFRKVKPIVLFRYNKLKHGSVKRSRKIMPLYYGISKIYQIAEGNPRTLIGIVNKLMDSLPAGKKELDIGAQSRILKGISEQSLRLLESHPNGTKIYQRREVNITTLLRYIGDYFHDKMFGPKFLMDPNGRFEIDDAIPSEMIELLELALYVGAIVYVDPRKALATEGLVGKKFRLSYLLHPSFDIPIMEYRSVLLSKIIQKESRVIQPSLFD